MKTDFVRMVMVLTFVLGAAAGGAAWAQENDATLTTQAAQMDRYATSKGQTTVSGKTAADFSKFYGPTNSQALADGLRSGSEVTLTTQAADGTTSTATFTPPTGSMGNGNVYISMALAKDQLAAAGITEPTAQQMEAAMMGGTLTPGGEPVQGVLEMRASGMGWGQIAQAYGTKLGPVISGMKSANTALSRTATVKPGTTTTTTGTTPTTATGKATTAKPKTTTGTGKSGIVTGAGGGASVVGGSKASGGKSGVVTGAGGTGGKSGIVTGAGGAGGAPSAAGGAQSQGQGAGVVTGGGAAGNGGQGKGYGKGGK